MSRQDRALRKPPEFAGARSIAPREIPANRLATPHAPQSGAIARPLTIGSQWRLSRHPSPGAPKPAKAAQKRPGIRLNQTESTGGGVLPHSSTLNSTLPIIQPHSSPCGGGIHTSRATAKLHTRFKRMPPGTRTVSERGCVADQPQQRDRCGCIQQPSRRIPHCRGSFRCPERNRAKFFIYVPAAVCLASRVGRPGAKNMQKRKKFLVKTHLDSDAASGFH